MERNLSKYQQLLADLDSLIDELDTLSSGLLSHTIILSGKLAELLDHVKRKLMEHFKKYKVAVTEVHQYYDKALVSYSYTADMLVLQTPIVCKTLLTANTENAVVVEHSPNRTLIGCNTLAFIQLLLDFIRSEDKPNLLCYLWVVRGTMCML